MHRQTEHSSAFRLSLAIGFTLLVAGIPAEAQQGPPSLAELREILAQQQSLIETQSEEIRRQREQLEEQSRRLADQAEVLQAVQTRVDQLSTTPSTSELTDSEVAVRERLARVEEVLESPPDAPPDVLRAGEFPGSIRIPGTNLAAQVGGFVRVGVVSNIDPIGSDDRFIVGTIPVEGTAEGDEGRRINLSAKRSRLNLDMRMDSSVGQFRAFVEGDFVGDGETDNYRLRHAYGQYKEFLIGQTWSTLTDRRAVPEDLDFEGMNGQIISRQTMVRWSRVAASGRRFALSMEDPSPDITGGEGVSVVPDLVFTVGRDRSWGHFRTGLLLRQIVGEAEAGSGQRKDEAAWGLNVSGTVQMKWNQRDNFKFQLSYGEGIGRYINDLESVGGQDAVFDLQGNLRALPSLGGYISYQRWWNTDLYGWLRNLRSTFVYSRVYVTNFDFQLPDAYNRTLRTSANLIWSPIPSIDIGLEYLWGERRNKDRQRGRASQLQAVATFRF